MDFNRRDRLCKSRLPFACKHCTRRFSRVQELQVHNKRHKKDYSKRLEILPVTPEKEREPIPKLVIRRNSSPIKNGGMPDEYEIVDLTLDDSLNDMEPVFIEIGLPPTAPVSLCSPSQKDSGIDDSSPQSCDEVRDSVETVKVNLGEPIYSPYVGVEKRINGTDNHNSTPSNSCFTCTDNSQMGLLGDCESVVKELDSDRNDTVPSVYTVELPVDTQVDPASGGNGFITIDIDRLSKIVGAGSVTDAQGNISVTLEPNSEASRNIFDAIAKSGTVNSDDYAPPPKKTRRSSDFDTGDSQFNFYDSNQVESLSVANATTATDSEPDTLHDHGHDADTLHDHGHDADTLHGHGHDADTLHGHDADTLHDHGHDTDTSFEMELQDSSVVDNSKQHLSLLDHCRSPQSQIPGDYDTDTSSQGTIEYGEETIIYSSCEEELDVDDSAHVNTHCETSWTPAIVDSPSKYQNEFTKFLVKKTAPAPPPSKQKHQAKTSNSNSVIPKSNALRRTYINSNIFDTLSMIKSVKVKLEDGEGLPRIMNRMRATNKEQKLKTKDESTKVPIKVEKPSQITDKGVAVHKAPIKINSPNELPSKVMVKQELAIKRTPRENQLNRIAPHRKFKGINQVRVAVQEQAVEEVVHVDILTVDDSHVSTTTTKCAFQTRRNIRTFSKDHARLVNLRRQVLCLLHVLFPRLEYPSYFKSGSICVDVLLDQLIAILQTDKNTDKIQTIQSIPLENVCCNVRVLVCPFTALTCLRNFRKKICRFLLHVLPQLPLSPSFRRTGEHVDDLLYQVIECNSPR